MRNFAHKNMLNRTMNTFNSTLPSKYGRPLTVLFLAMLAIGVDTSVPLHAATITRQDYTNMMVAKWTNMFGAVPFAEKHLFTCMHYVRPQPEEAFRPFTTEKMTERYSLQLEHRLGEFFKPVFHTAVRGLKPSKYYLNDGRKEPSLLRYDFELEGCRVVMVENFNVFFLTITPADFSSARPANSQVVAGLIHRWINVRDASQGEAAQKFGLGTQLRLGDVFTNRLQPEPQLMGSGRDHVVGFISKEGICLVVFKAQEERAAAGLPVNYNWVNQQIFEADGTTRMDHPKYFEQSRKTGEPAPAK